MKKLILILIFTFAISSFTETNASNKVPKKNNDAPYFLFEENDMKTFPSKKKISIDSTIFKVKAETLDLPCNAFADITATVVHLNGGHYWTAWFAAFEYCLFQQ